MKNIKVIAQYIRETKSETLYDNLPKLIMCLEENVRENALAILSGQTILTCLDADMVSVNYTNKYNNVEIKSYTPDYLAGCVNATIKYDKQVTKYVRDPERMDDSSSWKHDDYVIPVELWDQDRQAIRSFPLEEWNSGHIEFKN